MLPLSRKSKALVATCLTLWVGALGSGFKVLNDYARTPGPTAIALADWPSHSSLLRQANGKPTLVLFAHPKCSCSRASISELEAVLARTQGKVNTTIVFIQPKGWSTAEIQTDLWQRAKRMPGVTVLVDQTGSEARRFGALTSGQTLLYSPQGRLLFSGGITGSRGHEGDNAGRQSVIAAILGEPYDKNGTRVFGCALFKSYLAKAGHHHDGRADG